MKKPFTTIGEAQPIAFWLVPEATHTQMLQTEINRLATSRDAPRFVPHITLLTGALAPDESAANILSQVCESLATLTLRPTGIATGDTRFKSLYLRFDSAALLPITNVLRSHCRLPSHIQLDAHLSLMYQVLPIADRSRVVADVRIAYPPIRFDSICAVAPAVGETSFDRIEAWRIIASNSLRSA